MEVSDQFHTKGPLPTWKEPAETTAQSQSLHGDERKIPDYAGNQTLVIQLTVSHSAELSQGSWKV
jgi:hypothetical protein